MSAADKVRFFFVSAVVALLAVLYLIYLPRGSWMYIYFIMSAIATGGIIALFYGGAMQKMSGGALGGMFLLGAIGVVVQGSFNTAALKRLEAVIPPYTQNLEYIEELRDHPSMQKGLVIWRLKTSDGPKKVARFYRENENLAPWEWISQDKELVLKKEGATLAIKTDWSSGMTHITYEFRVAAAE